MDLTQQQVSYFDTFGFIKFAGLLSEEIDRITESFERVWAGHGGGHDGMAHDHMRRSALLPFIDQDEYLCGLLDDHRIDGIACSLLGDDFNYTASDGNFYVGDTNWHSDGYHEKKYMSIKMAFYLDPADRESGCLRVIPGSHKYGDAYANAVHEVAPGSKKNQTEEKWGVTGADVPAVALETQPGDLLVFNHSTKHSSFGGGSRRRMFTMNLQERYREEDLPELREEIGMLARFWAERAYGDVMLRTAGPSRMRHLEQRLANDDHLPGLVRKAREEMDEPSRS